jgi:uncharacterized protein YdiU (UPF0061 family)
MNSLIKSLKKIDFHNSQLANLFVKKPTSLGPKSSPHTNYSIVSPTPVEEPVLVLLSEKLCKVLELDYNSLLSKEKVEETTEVLSGNIIPDKSTPIAHCYCGYQFGNFAGQLGDGRAISIGDYYTSDKSIWELQWKGSGLTPYSRSADGRAVLRSSIREYLASEYLYELGFPTTRALSLIDSKSLAKRDPMYNGKVINEKCAIVTRVANSFMRFGSFEIFVDQDSTTGASGPSVNLEDEMMPKMIKYLIDYHFTKIKEAYILDNSKNSSEFNSLDVYPKELIKSVFEEIVKRTAYMVAFWQGYGFVHGVINTDNMSILGITIDYGPYGFLDYFDQFYIPNSSDTGGRYSFLK